MALAAASACMGKGLTVSQAVQPGPCTRLEVQATRRAGHGARGAAQNAKALLVNVMSS
jgi:hypothetical protein